MPFISSYTDLHCTYIQYVCMKQKHNNKLQNKQNNCNNNNSNDNSDAWMALPVIPCLLLLKPQVFYLEWIQKQPVYQQLPSTSTISEQQVILIFCTTWGLTDGKIVLEFDSVGWYVNIDLTIIIENCVRLSRRSFSIHKLR